MAAEKNLYIGKEGKCQMNQVHHEKVNAKHYPNIVLYIN